MRLANKIAVVTGGSRGIGRGIALKLASEGAKVAVNYRANSAAAAEVVGLIEEQGGEAIAVQADVSQMLAARSLIRTAADTYGRLDILVNNAGTTRDMLIMLMKEEDWDLVLNTNLKSAFNCCKAAARIMMRRRYGRIINITSIAGLAGQAGQTNYSASKAGLIGFTKALAKEVGPRNITVNAVAPGFVYTDLTADLPQEFKDIFLQATPLGRFGTPEDMASAVAFLASDEASFVTGQVLSVDGGLVMHV